MIPITASMPPTRACILLIVCPFLLDVVPSDETLPTFERTVRGQSDDEFVSPPLPARETRLLGDPVVTDPTDRVSQRPDRRAAETGESDAQEGIRRREG